MFQRQGSPWRPLAGASIEQRQAPDAHPGLPLPDQRWGALAELATTRPDAEKQLIPRLMWIERQRQVPDGAEDLPPHLQPSSNGWVGRSLRVLEGVIPRLD